MIALDEIAETALIEASRLQRKAWEMPKANILATYETGTEWPWLVRSDNSDLQVYKSLDEVFRYHPDAKIDVKSYGDWRVATDALVKDKLL